MQMEHQYSSYVFIYLLDEIFIMGLKNSSIMISRGNNLIFNYSNNSLGSILTLHRPGNLIS